MLQKNWIVSLPLTNQKKLHLGTDGSFSKTLKMAPMNSIDSTDCESSYQDILSEDWKLHRSFSCFNGSFAGTCTGDGGGPLVCPLMGDTERYMQVRA